MFHGVTAAVAEIKVARAVVARVVSVERIFQEEAVVDPARAGPVAAEDQSGGIVPIKQIVAHDDPAGHDPSVFRSYLNPVVVLAGEFDSMTIFRPPST